SVRRRRHAAGGRQGARRARGGAAAGERPEGFRRGEPRGPPRPPGRSSTAHHSRGRGRREGRDRAGARPRGPRRAVAGARVEPGGGEAGRGRAGRRPLDLRPLPPGPARRRPRPLRRRAALRRRERGGARRRPRPPPPGDPLPRRRLPPEHGPGARGSGALRDAPPRVPRLGARARRRLLPLPRPRRRTRQRRVAHAGLRAGAAVAAGATPPDQGAVVELLDGFEQRHPDAKDLHPRALELRLAARVATGRLEEASRDLDAFLALRAGAAERRGTLARVGRELATRAERAAPAEQPPALALARKVYTVLARESGDAGSRIVLAD